MFAVVQELDMVDPCYTSLNAVLFLLLLLLFLHANRPHFALNILSLSPLLRSQQTKLGRKEFRIRFGWL